MINYKQILENEIHFGSAVEEYRSSMTDSASVEDYFRHENHAWTSFISKAKGLTQLYQDKWQASIKAYYIHSIY